MTRAAGMVAGLSIAAVSSPTYAAESKVVKMGSDCERFSFIPNKITICSGDSVTWVNNRAGHNLYNVIFGKDTIPAGIDEDAISHWEVMGEEEDSFTMKFDDKGEYGYYCEPYRGAGMSGEVTVI